MSDDERGPNRGLGRRGAGAESTRPKRLLRPGYSKDGPQAPWLYNPGAPPLRPPKGPFSNVSRVIFQAGAPALEPSRRKGPSSALAANGCRLLHPAPSHAPTVKGLGADRPAKRGPPRNERGVWGGKGKWRGEPLALICAALARFAPAVRGPPAPPPTSPSARAVGRAAAATGPESRSRSDPPARSPARSAQPRGWPVDLDRTRENHPIRVTRLGQDPGGRPHGSYPSRGTRGDCPLRRSVGCRAVTAGTGGADCAAGDPIALAQPAALSA